MKGKRVVIVLVSGCVLVSMSGRLVGDTQDRVDPIDMINSETDSVRLRGLVAIATERDQRIRDLIEIVKSNPEKWASYSSRRGIACRVLGELRASEAADVLISIVHIEGRNDEGGGAPALLALIKIGNPAVAKLVQYIGGKEAGVGRRNAVSVLEAVYGARTAGFVLREAQRSLATGDYQRRLGEAIRELAVPAEPAGEELDR